MELQTLRIGLKLLFVWTKSGEAVIAFDTSNLELGEMLLDAERVHLNQAGMHRKSVFRDWVFKGVKNERKRYACQSDQ